MTKSDLHAITKGAAIGGGLTLLLWLFFRRSAAIREVLPTSVKWEGL